MLLRNLPGGGRVRWVTERKDRGWYEKWYSSVLLRLEASGRPGRNVFNEDYLAPSTKLDEVDFLIDK